jgi:hypothetical protein
MRGLKAMYLRCSNYASYKEGGALLPMRVSISNVHRLFALLVWRPARYHAVGALQWAVLSPVSTICVLSLPATMLVDAGLDSPKQAEDWSRSQLWHDTSSSVVGLRCGFTTMTIKSLTLTLTLTPPIGRLSIFSTWKLLSAPQG